MRFIVKNTTFCGLSDMVCPYHCRGCGKTGEILCECCKNYIIEEKLNHCPKCGRVIIDRCNACVFPFSAEFMVGYRDELIGALAEEFKFFGVRKLGRSLAEILNDFLPDFSGDVSIVPMPTIKKHVRERGLDHTYLIAKNLAKIRGWKVERLLFRKKIQYSSVRMRFRDDVRRRKLLVFLEKLIKIGLIFFSMIFGLLVRV